MVTEKKREQNRKGFMKYYAKNKKEVIARTLKWQKENKERTNYIKTRSGALTYIKRYASLEELRGIKKKLEAKKKELTEHE